MTIFVGPPMIVAVIDRTGMQCLTMYGEAFPAFQRGRWHAILLVVSCSLESFFVASSCRLPFVLGCWHCG
jgi:hypothetical protein